MNRDKSNLDTVEIPMPTSLSRALGPETGSARVQVDVAALSHQGHVRSANEDHYLVVRLDRTMRALLSNLPDGLVPEWDAATAYGMVVADGVGGGAGGEVASRTAIAASGPCASTAIPLCPSLRRTPPSGSTPGRPIAPSSRSFPIAGSRASASSISLPRTAARSAK